MPDVLDSWSRTKCSLLLRGSGTCDVSGLGFRDTHAKDTKRTESCTGRWPTMIVMIANETRVGSKAWHKI